MRMCTDPILQTKVAAIDGFAVHDCYLNTRSTWMHESRSTDVPITSDPSSTPPLQCCNVQ
jgi:hypothetical protein